ncbi:FeoC like transcriptional regulator [Gilliamella bombicola]|uniref:FeoC like transcriptional regulator n=1 Tax=Gilliamella bombicola TaxID=1798182 RepID=A0A1C3ZN43_9GAMM|nr:FeoC-like transcriptional regulator [Gilliamella bombicola]SCB83809.1 FeoC like transcriptional regulator [Gilliamella bombicola]
MAMLITSIRDYVQLKGRAPLQDIARHFQLPESATEQMLCFWIKKGVIKLIAQDQPLPCQANQCRSCTSCGLTSQLEYVWA